MINFQVFIASSLVLEDYRNAVTQAVNELNNEEKSCSFSAFDYTKSHQILQIQDTNSAQIPANKIIPESAFFILIIDGVVGEKTIEEYKEASRLCRNHHYPAYISLFHKKTPTSTVPCDGQILFEEFQKKYIDNARFDDEQKLVKDKLVYSYPFETAEDIRQKVLFELKKWIVSPYRPLLDAKMGVSFTQNDFYDDSIRYEHCIPGMYFRRPFDDKLLREIGNQHDIIYLYGVSLSGKTRAVFQVATKVPRSWFYLMYSHTKNIEKLKEQITDITHYLEYAKPEQGLFLIFDDFDKYRLEEESGLAEVLRQLFTEVHNSQCTVIITASTPVKDLPVADLFESLNVVKIEIPQMSPEECVEATQLFRRNGIIIEEQNTRYHTTGALLINLNNKKVEYQAFLNKAKGNAKILRKNLLRTIKAFSIWHNSNIGDLDSMYHFCAYLISTQECDEEGNPLKISRNQFNCAIENLLKCTGITDASYISSLNQKVEMLNIQEYIYRFFINYSGEVLLDDKELTVSEELKLIYLIMSYVYQQNNPLIIDFAKTITRSEHRKEVSEHLFGLWQSTIAPLEENNEWVIGLQNEKKAIEEGKRLDSFREEVPLYYPKIFKQKIYDAETFEEACSYYNMAKEGLRDQFMLSAIFVKASLPEETLWVESLSEYSQYKKEPFVLYKRLAKQKNFADGLNIFNEFERPDSKTYLNNILHPDPISLHEKKNNELFIFNFNINWYRQALNHLFRLVSTEDELEKVCRLIRENYIFCTNDQNLLRYCEMNTEESVYQQLTLIDLLAIVDIYKLISTFGRLFQKDIDPMENFLTGKLLTAISDTLLHAWTPRYRLRIVIATIANAFIRQLKEDDYQDVYNHLFIHLKDEKNKLILRDPYTYSYLLDMKDCSLWQGLNLFYYDIESHAKDPNNFLNINHFILNKLLEKAKKEGSTQILGVNQMFDDYGVERDRYSYNLILESIPYEEGLQIIKTMVRKKIPLDEYTVCSLIRSASDMSTALSFFDKEQLQIPAEVKVHDLFSNDRELMYKMSEIQLKSIVASQQYSWVCLFSKNCRNEAERKVIDNCLSYLENNKSLSGLLEKGNLYNVCLKNHTYIRNYAELTDFLEHHKDYLVFDSYSLTHAIDILLHEDTPKTHWRVVDNVNELFRRASEKKVKITDIHYNNRIGLFMSHLERDAQPMVFFNKDGKAIEEVCTPLQYIKHMENYNIPISRFTIIELTKVNNSMSDRILNQILDFCPQHSITLDSKMQRTILDTYRTIIMPDTLQKMDILVSNSNSNLYNKQLVSDYTKGYLSFEDAIEKVNTSAVFSSAIAYNALLSQFGKKTKNKFHKNQDNIDRKALFPKAWTIYQNYILKKSRPTTETFSILAGMVSSLDDLQALQLEIQRLNTTQKYNLKITSFILTAYLHFAKNIHDLRSYLQAYERAGGELSSSYADILLRTLVRLANTHNDPEASDFVQEMITYILYRPEVTPSFFNELPLLANFCEASSVTKETIVDLLNFKETRNHLDCQKIVESLLCYYPHLLMEQKGIAEYLGKRNEQISWYISTFEILNTNNDETVTKFRCDLLCCLINKYLNDSSPYPLNYDNYKTLIHFWIGGKYSRKDWNRIAVAMTMLLRKLGRNSKGEPEFRTILNKFYASAYDDKLTVNNFLKPEDAQPDLFEFKLRDDSMETLLFFNNILLYKVKTITQTRSKDIDAQIFNLISHFLRRHALYYLTFREICSKHITNYKGLYNLLPLVNTSSECLLVLLTCMGNTAQGYKGVAQTLRIALQYNIDLQDELMSNLARKITRDKYEDAKLRKVYAQILYGIRTDTLCGYHFLAGDDALLPNLNRPVHLFADVKEELLLCSNIYNSNDPIKAGRLLVDHCCNTRKDAQERGVSKETILINSMFINSLLSLYTKLCQKTAHEVRREDKESWIELIKNIYRLSSSGRVDVSPLFLNPQQLEELHEMQFNLELPQRYLDYTILRKLEISLEDKMRFVIEAKALPKWLKSYDSSEEILELLSYFKEQAPEYIKTVIIAALNKVVRVETFQIILQELDTYENCLEDNRCVQKLFERLIYFLPTNHDLYITLSHTDLTLPDVCSLRDLNKLFHELKLRSVVNITMDNYLATNYCKLLKENQLFGNINNLSDIEQVYNYLRNHVYHGGYITNDFLIVRLLKVHDVRSKIIQDLYEKGEFNLHHLARPGVESKAFRAKMSSEILNYLLAGLSSNHQSENITRLDLFHRTLETQGSSYIDDRNLSMIISSLKTPDDYKRFMEEIHLYEFDLTDAQRRKLVLLLKDLSISTHEPDTEIIRQVYSRVVTNAETDTLVNGHFDGVEFKEILFDAWGNTPINAEVVLGAIGKRSLSEIICRNMYKLPDQYVKSLIILQNHKSRHPQSQLNDFVIKEVQSYERHYIEHIEKEEVSFWELRRIPLYWNRIEWQPQTSILTALFRYYKSLSNEVSPTDKDIPELPQRFAAHTVEILKQRLTTAEQMGFQKVRIYMKDLSERLKKSTVKIYVYYPLNELKKILEL